MNAKAIVRDALEARGVPAEVEKILETRHGGRRADVLTSHPKGRQLAIELQHTPIDLDELERRFYSYAHAGFAQIWIPFIAPRLWERSERRRTDLWVIPRYSPKPFEHFLDHVNRGSGLWYYDPRHERFWNGHYEEQFRYVEDRSWYDENGDEQYSPGGWTAYRSWKELHLCGPYEIEDLKFKIRWVAGETRGDYRFPSCPIAVFEAA